MTRKESAARRTEARERRRAETSDGDGATTRESATQAARTAVAAAAVGAAVGALRALGTRPGDAGEEEPQTHEPEPETETPSSAGDATQEQQEQGQERAQEQEQQHEQRERNEEPRTGAAPDTVRRMAARAREQLRDLQGREAESVTALERISDGWRVTFEVVEVHRVPESTDVLATYAVELDENGELIRYERLGRYYRAQADRGGGA